MLFMKLKPISAVRSQKLSDTDQQNILALMKKQPDITCLEIIETLNLPESMDTVWRFLQKQGISS